MSKQSSIDYLFERFYANEGMITTKQLEQAKAMHKDEICTAFRIGEKFAVDYYLESELDSDEQYYYETFNTKEK